MFVCVWMCALLAPELLEGFYSYLVFESCRLVSGECEQPSSKMGTVHMGQKIKLRFSSKTDAVVLTKFQ
jgi:hypothetical protein